MLTIARRAAVEEGIGNDFHRRAAHRGAAGVRGVRADPDGLHQPAEHQRVAERAATCLTSDVTSAARSHELRDGHELTDGPTPDMEEVAASSGSSSLDICRYEG